MKKGFTLMELMAYIAVVGIIVLVAGQAFSDSTKFNVRSRNMVTAAQLANEVSSIVKEDIAQLGTKSWNQKNTEIFFADPLVYMNVNTEPHDSSSYSLIRNGTGIDDLTFRKIEYNQEGVAIGVRQVEWTVQDIANGVGKLVRSCKTISGTANTECPSDTPFEVVISENVSGFSVTPSIPGSEQASSSSTASNQSQLFPEISSSSMSNNFRLLTRTGSMNDPTIGAIEFTGSVEPADGGESVTITNLHTNYSEAGSPATIYITSAYVAKYGESSNEWNTGCYEFTFYPQEVYSFEFRLGYVSDNMRLFQPTKDLFSIGLRKKDNGSRISTAKVNDFTLYPPTTSAATQTRYGRFTIAGDAPVKACLAFTVAIYSPLTHQGNLVVRNFKVSKELSEAYHFPGIGEFYTYNPTDGETKKNVKAFRLQIEINRHGEKSLVETEINIPSNGAKATSTE